MSILTFVVSVVVLGAFAALLTNGIMEGLKQLPFIEKLPAAAKFALMLAVSAGCSAIVADGAKTYVSASFWLLWLSAVAAAQLGYDKIIKRKIENLEGCGNDKRIDSDKCGGK